jgi:hypothetical protein
MRSHQFSFGNAELAGEIALAHFGIVSSRPPDFVWVGPYALVHLKTPTC